MVEKFELSYGRHEDFYYNCAGCLINNSIWVANTPQPIFLTLTYLVIKNGIDINFVNTLTITLLLKVEI